MSIQLNPYLTFNGTAEKAIALYESALGAKVETLSRFGDAPAPAGGPPMPEALKGLVMHAMLRVGAGVVMISDRMPNDPAKLDGDNISVCLNFDDPAETAKCFEALAVGGKVTSPLQDTFWGAKFGLLVDTHGISWMFNCDLKKK